MGVFGAGAKNLAPPPPPRDPHTLAYTHNNNTQPQTPRDTRLTSNPVRLDATRARVKKTEISAACDENATPSAQKSANTTPGLDAGKSTVPTAAAPTAMSACVSAASARCAPHSAAGARPIASIDSRILSSFSSTMARTARMIGSWYARMKSAPMLGSTN